jgi:hypothetical protein
MHAIKNISRVLCIDLYTSGRIKSNNVQVWKGSEVSRKVRQPDFQTIREIILILTSITS